MEAFALKTAGNPPSVRLIDVDLKFVALWFADPQDSAQFTNIPALAFDEDREFGCGCSWNYGSTSLIEALSMARGTD